MARTKKEKNIKAKPLEKQLWKAADKLRKNIDAAEYKHVLLGFIFLKYISDSFEEMYEKLKEGKGDYASADPEDKDEYKAENVFFVPQEARWPLLPKLMNGGIRVAEYENNNSMDVLNNQHMGC